MNNLLPRWEVYNAHSIGLENMFKKLDAFADNPQSNYPPYNLIKLDDERQQLQMALAGFLKEDIEVAIEKKVLNISVSKTYETEGDYVHKGIAQRSFSRNWQLSDDTVIDEVTYIDGLLRVTLRREVPEEQKRKLFPIS
jgi:molecular chaperone IbpA